MEEQTQLELELVETAECYLYAYNVSTILINRATEGDYTYIDGSPVDFVDWTAGRPQGVGNDCVAVSTKNSFYRYGSMTDLKCSEKHQFISKRPLDGKSIGKYDELIKKYAMIHI